MTTDITEAVAFGGPKFWALYDEFCSEASLTKLVEERHYPLANEMHAITYAAHHTREIHHLSRPERGWSHHHAWLALKSTEIHNLHGDPIIFVRAGDVVVVEHQWDRDDFLTHSPKIQWVCGYLLSGKWEPMIGLFLPLFDKKTIEVCIKLRIKKNSEDALALMEKEAMDWTWYLS